MHSIAMIYPFIYNPCRAMHCCMDPPSGSGADTKRAHLAADYKPGATRGLLLARGLCAAVSNFGGLSCRRPANGGLRAGHCGDAHIRIQYQVRSKTPLNFDRLGSTRVATSTSSAVCCNLICQWSLVMISSRSMFVASKKDTTLRLRFAFVE